MIGYYQVFGFDVWLKTCKPIQQRGKTNHRTDQRLDPIEFVFQIANNYPHYIQIDGVDTETNIPILKPTDLFSVLWIEYEKMRSLSFST